MAPVLCLRAGPAASWGHTAGPVGSESVALCSRNSDRRTEAFLATGAQVARCYGTFLVTVALAIARNIGTWLIRVPTHTELERRSDVVAYRHHTSKAPQYQSVICWAGAVTAFLAPPA